MEKVKSTVLEYKHNPKLILLEKRYIAEGLPQEGQTDLVLINLNGDKILSFSCATVNNKWTAKNNCSYLEFVCFEDFFAVCETKRGKENDKDVLIYD